MSRAANLWVSRLQVEGDREATTSKFILWVLAEWSRECGHSWVSNARLSEIVQRTTGTVRHALSELERLGLIAIRLRFGPSGKQLTNAYELMFPADQKRLDPDCMVCDPSVTSAIERPDRRLNGDRQAAEHPSGSAPLSLSGRGPLPLSERDTPPPEREGQEDSYSESINPVPTPRASGSPELIKRDHAADPKWLSALHDIPGWPCQKDEALIGRLKEHAISDQDALMSATALVAKWDPKKWKRPDLTFINWALREQKGNGKPGAAVSANRAGELGAFADVDRYAGFAAEQQRTGDYSMPPMR